MWWRRSIFAFPPDIAIISHCDVCIKRVVLDRFHRVGIGFVTRPGNDAEITILGIDRIESAISADLHPRDVITDRRDFPAFEMFGRNEHREIRLPACAWERRGHVMLAAFRRL